MSNSIDPKKAPQNQRRPLPGPNSYVPNHAPPPSPAAPAIIPAPNVENKIQLPGTMQVTTLTDLVSRIQENTTVLYPAIPRLRVTTALAPQSAAFGAPKRGQLVYHALVLAPKNEERETSRYGVLIKGPGVVAGGRGSGERREALMGLLEEVERRVGKEMLGGGG
ncbi:hypothetical protein K490DRAFT_69714 [Saccharata proteae CBS 121410]|uniref:Uncharacterized protein n=1 Tax=Saccharata proteae CBS 121410 TaxID=1314787 RepID=A0A9P4HPF2_9PEZI|nr:hypothetical protein K490DRAFT_69714 [Saccharata proteae CBS 121410]